MTDLLVPGGAQADVIDPRWPGLTGVQTPRLKHFPTELVNHPTHFSSLGDDAVDLAELAGLELLPWQEMILRESLGERTDGLWSSATVCLIVPRQNGKNVCVYARELAGLFLLGERIVHTAHEFATADDAWKELKALIEGCDLDDECVKPHLHGGAEVSIRAKNGGFVRYRARGNGSMRGLTKIGLFIADEAFAVTGPQMGSAKPIMQAAKRRQLWLTSSAGFDDSETLANFRQQGIDKTNPRLLFAEWSCEEGSDPDEYHNRNIANPSHGAPFCTPEAMEENYRDLPVDQWAREHLGMWDDPRVNSVIPFDKWKHESVVVPDGETVDLGLTVACVDVAPDNAWASIAIAGRRLDDARSHVEVVHSDTGVAWILPMMQRLMASSKPPKAVVVQGGAAAGAYGPELEQIGFEVKYFGQADIAQATAQFYTDVVDLKLTHLDDELLLEGLSGAAKYPIGKPELNQWGWLRKSALVNITGVVACSYANRLLTLKSVEQTLTQKKRHRMW
ncbi:phage terminase, large subunit, putative [Mycobacteroides abscessus subsp. abscessus]|nr:phage terminase, large subunit, putative [Mycobacteroides abscessus subsp. abscessus]